MGVGLGEGGQTHYELAEVSVVKGRANAVDANRDRANIGGSLEGGIVFACVVAAVALAHESAGFIGEPTC